ncbi:MAG TPA: SAM-dependent chlorinase/fluorinase [Candidatus Limnocylindrales bacterium]|nr:SAM-dependent chlorinase/fluorinase [Candidatus Limnocylindrales bacterium]
MTMATRPVITFLSDFGPAAPAVCRGVMFGIAPDANIIDVSHQVPRYSIRDGAASLVFALPHMPVGVHLAVVDPGVGTDRLAIAIKTGRGDVLVGPDNGLLVEAAERLGGIVEARVLENRAYWLPVVSSSFHGRDIFAPSAAHLAMGAPFESVGRVVPTDALVRIERPQAKVATGRLETVVIHVMAFGNVTFAGSPLDLTSAVGPLTEGRPLRLTFGPPRARTVEAGTRDDAPAGTGDAAVGDPVVEDTVWGFTFGSVPIGHSVLMSDSEGRLSLSDNQGDAARRLGLSVDRPVTITAR